MRKIDRSIVPRCFRASFLSSSRVSFALLSSSSSVLFFSSQKRQNARRRGRRHMYSYRRAIASRRFVFLYTLTSRRFLSLSLSNNTVCCIGAGYVGGPTMAMIALKCPHIEVNRESVSHQSRFCAFHHDIVHLYYSSPKCAGPKCPRVRHTTGPRRRRHFFDDARDAIAEEKRSRRTIGRVVGGLLSPFFVGSGVLTLSLSLSRECNTNPLSSLKCTNLFFSLRTKRSPWSI